MDIVDFIWHREFLYAHAPSGIDRYAGKGLWSVRARGNDQTYIDESPDAFRMMSELHYLVIKLPIVESRRKKFDEGLYSFALIDRVRFKDSNPFDLVDLNDF